ncbi:hypothetical protein [Desulforamulus aquiferis]|uniref:Uncharacterized protein n=1 Tax=Desulforamulus aquiferis TaxID=1397668 RepID=A0AAW7ZDQ5_9FIRM|nr:hypothetical protein [Desulforamulus aquiferis]MDO7787289.1 hypothetical protein [Desulforamulus aquiferis]
MDSLIQLFLLFIAVISIIYYDTTPLIKNKAWKEALFSLALLLLGSSLLCLWMMGIRLPAPFKALGVY